MFQQEEFSLISHLDGTFVIDRNLIAQSIPMIISREPLLVTQTQFDEYRVNEGIIGHPDVFYTIGRAREQVTKFGFEEKIGISPVVLNTSFLLRNASHPPEGDFSDLLPFIQRRANFEIETILTNIDRFLSPYLIDASKIMHERIDIQAWIEALKMAEQAGKMDRLVSFYKEALKVTGIPLSADDKYNQKELELMDRALNEYKPKPIQKRRFGLFH